MGAQPGLELAGRDLSFRKGVIQEQSVQTVKRFVNCILSPASRADARRSRPSRSRSEVSFLIRSNYRAAGVRRHVHRPRIPSRPKSTVSGKNSTDVLCRCTQAWQPPHLLILRLNLFHSSAQRPGARRIWLSYRLSLWCFSSMAVRKLSPQSPP